MGTATFMFTDIAGSTSKWREFPAEMAAALESHDREVRSCIEAAGGRVFKHTGDGFGAVFESAGSALGCAVAIQERLSGIDHPQVGPLEVRIGVHAGDAQERDGDFFGYTVSRTARIMSAGHGGQTLVSEVARDLAEPATVTLVSLGMHRLQDLGGPEHLYQLATDGSPGEFPPLRTLELTPNNLPISPTSFVGRDQELEELAKLVRGARTVTVAGVGGSGKTRLALQVGADLAHEVTDGVWLVELAAVTDPQQIGNAFVEGLRLPEGSGGIRRQLLDHLAGKELLLIVDNCEHLIDSAAELIAEILTHAPDVKVVATSRELLGVPGEVSYRLPSMRVPARTDDPETVHRADAVRLFVDRATAARPDFRITKSNSASVVDVCSRLDGIPLAIELAAARLRTFGVEEVSRHLDQRFRLLTGGSRTALPRQQTLTATIEWSYRLLDEQEAALFRRLSVFMGGFTYDGVVGICTDDLIDEFAVLELLPALVDKSLVVAETGSDESRYRLLETLRQFARDRLDDQGESDLWRRRHATHFARFCEESTLETLLGSGDDGAPERFNAEMENMRQGLVWAIGSGEGCVARQLFVGYSRASRLVNTVELLDFHDQVTALDGSGCPAATAVRMQTMKAWALYREGQVDPAIEEVSGAVQRGRDDADGDEVMVEALESALNGWSYMLLYTGRAGDRNERYIEIQEEILELADRYGHRWARAATLANIAHHRDPQGDPAVARRVFEQAEEAARSVARLRLAGLNEQRGFFEWHSGDYEAAARHFQKSVDLNEELDQATEARTMAVYAATARAMADGTASPEVGSAIGAALADPNVDPRLLTTFAVMGATNHALAGRHKAVAQIAGIVRSLEAADMAVRWDLAPTFEQITADAQDALGPDEFERIADSGEGVEAEERLRAFGAE